MLVRYADTAVYKSIIGQRRQQALQRLRTLLNTTEPQPVRQMVRFWDTQSNNISYQQIREMLQGGTIDESFIEQWRQEYAVLVTDSFLPIWIEAIRESQEILTQQFPVYNFNPAVGNIAEWSAVHAAEFISYLTDEQTKAMNAIIKRAAVLQDMPMEELSKVIRPLIGINTPQATANINYYNNLIANGVSPAKAKKLSQSYADKQHRYRATMIARTEISDAYNAGELLGIKEAQTQGLIGETNKKWVTAEDDRVCEWCKKLNGTEVGLYEDFYSVEFGTVTAPTLHPNCRCVIAYIETSPPIKFIN